MDLACEDCGSVVLKPAHNVRRFCVDCVQRRNTEAKRAAAKRQRESGRYYKPFVGFIRA